MEKKNTSSCSDKITVQEVDILLGLLRQIPKDLPPKSESLYNECKEKAKAEMLEKLNESVSQHAHPPELNVPIQKELTDYDRYQQECHIKRFEKIVSDGAAIYYREKDPLWMKAAEEQELLIRPILKQFYYALYPVQEKLKEIDLTQGTLLHMNLLEIMDSSGAIALNHALVQEAIDALESIRRKVGDDKPTAGEHNQNNDHSENLTSGGSNNDRTIAQYASALTTPKTDDKRIQIDLVAFMKSYCDLTNCGDVKKCRDNLYRCKQITLTDAVQKSNGRVRQFWVADLLKNWNNHKKHVPSIPPLKPMVQLAKQFPTNKTT